RDPLANREREPPAAFALDRGLVKVVLELGAADPLGSLAQEIVEPAANEVLMVLLQAVETARALRDGGVLSHAAVLVSKAEGPLGSGNLLDRLHDPVADLVNF